MKKYIFILDALELMTKLIAGKRVEGVLYVDENTGRLTFKAYNRQPRVREKDRMVKKLPWGWVKESMERIKVFGSFPKDFCTAFKSDMEALVTIIAVGAYAERHENMFYITDLQTL